MATERDLRGLPAPVWECMARSLDIETLAACCCACREWNSLLNSDEKFWEEACKFSDLKPETFPGDCGDWREYALLILKRLRQMRNSECFRESGSTIDRTEEDGVKAIYYYNNKLAVATRNRVEMWDISPETLLFEIHCGRPIPQITSVKFDDRYVLVGDAWSRIRSFDVASQEQRSSYEGQNDILSSYDFESEIDIVVGSYLNNIIQIWELSTGRLLKRLTNTDLSLIVKVKLAVICKPEILQVGVIYLFVMDAYSLFRWTITIDGLISENGIECGSNPWRLNLNMAGELSRNVNPKSSLLCRGKLLYFPESSAFVQSEAIGELELDSMNKRQIRPREKIKHLLAVGRKYIAFHTEEEDGVREKVRVFEMSDKKQIATYEVPDDLADDSEHAENDALIFCDRGWLDGLDLTNDRGLLLAYIRNDRKVYFVNWVARHEFAR